MHELQIQNPLHTSELHYLQGTGIMLHIYTSVAHRLVAVATYNYI